MKKKQTNQKQAVRSVYRTRATPTRTRHSRTEEQLQSILQVLTEFYGIWNISSGPIHVNGNCLKALGASNGDSPARLIPLQSLMHAQDRSEFEAHIKAYVAGNTPALDCEFRLRIKGGPFRWFALRGKTIRHDRRGTPVEIAYGVRDIHAAKEQQQQILASRERLTAILDAMPDSVCVVDPLEFRILAFNRAFEGLILRAHGVRPTIGMRAEDAVPERADLWNGLYRQVLEKGQIGNDYFLPGLNETHHVFAQSLVRDGRVWGVGIFGHDVTDRKRTEEALRKSEEKFAKAFRDAPLALSLLSLRDDRYIDVNDAFAEYTGYSREELIGRTAHELNVWANPEQRMELVSKVQLTGEIRNLEIPYRAKSGEVHQAVGSVALIEIDDEPCMLSVVMDITERKRTVEALTESEERLRIAIEAGHMYAFEWDLSTDLVERSKQSSSMLELPGDGARYPKQELIDRMMTEDRDRYVQSLNSLTPEQPDYKTVFRLPLRNGRTAWLEESGRGIFGADGQLRKVIGITADVTEVRESESALRELSGRLITSQEEERRRVARELHDHIGQEAALICVQAQRLDSGLADQEQTARSDIHELYRKIKVLAADVSKLSHRLHSSELGFLGLSVAAERLCRDFADQFGIDVDFQRKAIPTGLDSVRSLCLYRVLQEALQNVAKHSHASRVVVELQKVKDDLVLNVRDNGSGFDVQNTGSGLGLLSMRERLNFVGGQFRITSSPGCGATLTAQVAV